MKPHRNDGIDPAEVSSPTFSLIQLNHSSPYRMPPTPELSLDEKVATEPAVMS